MSLTNERSRPGVGAAPDEKAGDRLSTSSLTHPTDGRERAHRNADPWWLSCAEAAFGALTETDARAFTVDDLVALGVPRPDAPCRLGSFLGVKYRQGLIEPVGARLSTVDGRPLRVWRAVAA